MPPPAAELARFFRPPFGTYSARSLQLAEQLGYTTVFWSFAHYDYDEGVQPPASVTLRRILSSAAPASIYLLHASSRSNVNALARPSTASRRRATTSRRWTSCARPYARFRVRNTLSAMRITAATR